MAIHILSPEVVDQIAAGEVVERPAHLVKELIENSIDAEATEIEIDFDFGGRFVRIKDNGKGISQEDLPLALARHATSKISVSSDIWNLISYGFRGEALATISAVSRFSIKSRTSDAVHAAEVRSEFGRPEPLEEVGGDLGTTVTVEDLFANVPARLKFLKSDAAEISQIKSVVKAMAMSHHRVSFRVRQAGKLLNYWPATELRQARVEQVLEREPLYRATYTEAGLAIEGYFGSPQLTEKTSRQIWIFAQGRWIQDRAIQAAIMDSYRNLLMHGEYPVGSLWVNCDPSQIDVNIHPAKSAVKFQNSSQIFRAVVRAVRGFLETAPWVASLVGEGAPQGRVFAPAPSGVVTEPAPEPMSFAETTSDSAFRRTQFQKKEVPITLAVLREYSSQPTRVAVVRSPQAPPAVTEADRSDGSHETSQSSALGRWAKLQVLGQANLTYIIGQSAKGIVLIDQHAAHERVAFEKLMAAFTGGWVDVQQFLIPIQVELEASQLEGALSQKVPLEKLGLLIEQIGPTTLGVTAAPSLLKESAIVSAVQRVAEEVLERGGSFAFEKIIGDICATMACHSVVRAGQALSHEQMTSLLAQMDEFPLSSFCPHGRPVSVEYPFDRIERDFGRIL